MKLDVERWGIVFQNPVMLAAGTCGFGEELREVVMTRLICPRKIAWRS